MASAILGLLAETSIHAGTSASSGVIDLPIQREAHTGWPCVFGSGVKGALRAASDVEQIGEAQDSRVIERSLRATAERQGASWVEEVFGPALTGSGNGRTAIDNASDHAGSLMVGDARLFLLPVRSLTSHFKWVTCPALLRRFVADCRRMQIAVDDSIQQELDELSPTNEQAVTSLVKPSGGHQDKSRGGGRRNTAENEVEARVERLFLEELSFAVQAQSLKEVVGFLAQTMAVPNAEKLLNAQLCIVSDDVFVHLSQFATPVTAHICIDNETKTVKTGALWYEETLPPETVLYACLSAQKSRKKDSQMSAQQVLQHVLDLFSERPYLQLGGNETVGMGWCKTGVITTFAKSNAEMSAVGSNVGMLAQGGS